MKNLVTLSALLVCLLLTFTAKAEDSPRFKCILHATYQVADSGRFVRLVVTHMEDPTYDPNRTFTELLNITTRATEQQLIDYSKRVEGCRK